MNRRGQATTEMIFIIPLLISVIGGGMFLVYGAWQGLRTQQAANLAARIQGQERVSGGTDLRSIDDLNGATGEGDSDPTLDANRAYTRGGEKAQIALHKPSNSSSVYARFYTLIKEQFFANAQDKVAIPPPLIGQNVDQVKVVRVIDMPKIPFLTGGTLPKQITIESKAWGGEDTYMYGLPRWGHSSTSGNDPEWRKLVTDANSDPSQHD